MGLFGGRARRREGRKGYWLEVGKTNRGQLSIECVGSFSLAENMPMNWIT